MRGIPPEIDRLMWAVAEEANPNAEAEFLRRYPVYREELLRRRDAVSGLKTGRPKVAAQPKPIPRFVPREPVRPAPRPAMALAVGAMVLASIAVASYTVTTMLSAPVANHPAEHTVPPNPAPQPPYRENPDPGVQPGEQHQDRTPVDSNPVIPHESPGQVNPPVEVPPYEKPQSLVVKRAGLVDVLQLLGAETGMKVVVAPGMPNPTVAVEYHDMTAMEMLTDLGNRYHFTPFDQGDGSVVVYPVEKGPAGAGNLRKLGG